MLPEKLKTGDEIRIVAPSRSLSLLSEEIIHFAQYRLEDMGLRVTFGKHVYETDCQSSSSISSRVEDLHAAFTDSNVKGILSVIGGHNSNELLPYLDYSLIRQHPKIFCGYSDITALASAIYAKTGLITYSGPHFSSFGIKRRNDYQLELFKKCIMTDAEFTIPSSAFYSDDAWFLDQENRQFIQNDGLNIYAEGQAEGILIGGNLCTLNLLQGTDFMPSLKKAVLFIEDDKLSDPNTFARDLASLLQQKDSGTVQGIVIGKFQKDSVLPNKLLVRILDKHPLLKTIPVMYGANFGHTQPIFTFPIGGTVKLDTSAKLIQMIEH